MSRERDVTRAACGASQGALRYGTGTGAGTGPGPGAGTGAGTGPGAGYRIPAPVSVSYRRKLDADSMRVTCARIRASHARRSVQPC